MEHDRFFEELFSPGGLLHRSFPHFEERKEQLEMAKVIGSAYLKNRVALIEAGTGIGKSLAYLAPAVFWAMQEKERTVISTHTIALQEQLIEKELPFLLNLLQADVKVSLVKGMGNYVCLRKFHESDEKETKMERFIETTEEGSRSAISFPLSPGAWEKVSAEPSRCTGSKCPYYKPCFFFKARRRLEDSKVLVVNHHLLMADLMAEGDRAILPSFDRLVIDEAHNFEDVALQALSKQVDRQSVLKVLSHKFDVPADLSSTLRIKIELDIAAEMHRLFTHAEEAFRMLLQAIPFNVVSLRVRDPLSPDIEEAFTLLYKDLHKLSVSLIAAAKDAPEALSLDCLAVAGELAEDADNLALFFTHEGEETRLRWIEISATNLFLREADLDIAAQLKAKIFDRFSTTTLCSATMAAGRDFSFARKRLGVDISNRTAVEAIYDSPFDYENRAFLGIPSDMPFPHEPGFVQAASSKVEMILRKTGGGAFVLFTSYDMLNQCYHLLKEKFTILRQGDSARTLLLDKFKERNDSVLFGTDSFWEGVDVPGDALRCVIIVKLPFKVPDDPIVAARGDLLKKEGKDPFMDYLLPDAAIKFKQGFGRLMRRKTDSGCIICLDKRLMTKNYGKTFLKSLPRCPLYFEPCDKIAARI